jgi:glycosyltransferase involved in cell wall biosynthesis
MRAVFAHDHVFVCHEDRVYSPGRLPYAAWHRYLEHFATLTVVARARVATSAAEVEGMSRADGPGVQFLFQGAASGVRRLLPHGSTSQRALRELISSVDAVIARIPSRIGATVAGLAATARLPNAVEVVGSAFHALWHHGSIAAKLYAPLLDVQTKYTAQRAGAALYVTKRYLQQRYPCRGPTASASNVVIPRPDPILLEARRTRVQGRQGPLVVGFVGTLTDRHKGLDTLLEALARTEIVRSECVLKVVGEGDQTPWRTMTRQMGLSDRVEFVGALPDSAAVREWMQTIDLFVLPSKGGEGLPRALIEAMSCGCLAYATDVGGVSELLPASCLIGRGQSLRLAAKIEAAARQPQLLVEAVSQNSAVAQQYSADVLEGVRRQFFGQLARQAQLRARSGPTMDLESPQ